MPNLGKTGGSNAVGHVVWIETEKEEIETGTGNQKR